MKKLIPFCLLTLLLAFSEGINAQYVTIPDTVFVNWLQSNGYAGCMNGNQLDTTCPAVLNATAMSCYAVPIRDLTGLQYFKNLSTLDCSNDSLYNIPAFPSLLTSINCQYNNLQNLPALPVNLGTLQCPYNQLSSLPALPANLIDLYCYYNQLSSLPILPASLNHLVCSANQLSSLPALPANLIELDCSNNQLTSLPALPANLIYLYCNFNQLSSLPTLPATLHDLGCYSNQLNSLPALPAILNHLECQGNQLDSLPALPISLGQLYCNENQISSLPVLPANLYDLDCSNNQIISLPTLPTSLYTLWCSNNQLISLPALPATLYQLECNNNQIISLPALPHNLTYLLCYNNQLSSLPALPDSLLYLYCYNNPNLSCLPELKRIVYFYFYGTAITCLPNYGIVSGSIPPLSSIPLCGIFNTSGCQAFWNISGQCFYDQNSDCLFDAVDVGTNYVKTQLYSGGNLVQQTFSGGEGFYSFDSVPYGTYAVTVDTSNLPFTVLCPASGSFNDTLSAVDSLSYNNNFAFKCRSVGFDVGVRSVLNNYVTPRPNAVFSLNTLAGDMSQLYGANCAGGISGQVQITYSGQITYLGPAAGALNPTSVTGNTITWAIADFGAVNVYSAFNLLFKVDSLAAAGTQACFTISVTPLSGDYNPSNNTLNYCFTIVNAIDPNEKEVYPTQIDSAGQWLTYTIRFQNTGTAAALNIRVTDTLDNHLDPASFQLLTFSAKNITQIFGNTVVFNFPNINLPDSATSDSASHGYIQYRIKTKAGIPGDAVSNTASIYFDLNPAVVTNTATVNYALATGIAKVNPEFTFSIYPNPANTVLYIKTTDIGPGSMKLYSITGGIIYDGKFEPRIDLNHLSPGTYFIELKAGEQTGRKMFVKM